MKNRFLDFLVREASIASNPVAELRTKYLIKGSATIVRALLASEPDRALEALRQLPHFGSVLGDLMRNHVALMRTRGFRYDTNTRMFLRFDRFLQRHPELANEPVPVMLQRWAAARSTAFHAVDCELLGRALAKARRHLDPSVPVPRPDRHPHRRFAREWRRPYIYSPEEVRVLLDIARTYPSPRARLRPLTLYTMLAVGYCAGLRVSVRVVTVAAVLQDWRMRPQKRPALLGMAGVTDLVYRRLNQLMLIGAAVRVVAVSADHQALAQRHVRRHVHLILFFEVAPETDLSLGPRIDERVGSELGSELVIRGLMHDHMAVDAFDASEGMHTGLPERLVALLMTGETRANLARLRFARQSRSI